MYIVYILFMNHMHAGEWERAPGRTFTADILPILNCAHISLYPYTFHFCVKSLYTQLYTVCPNRTCNTLLVQYHHNLYIIEIIIPFKLPLHSTYTYMFIYYYWRCDTHFMQMQIFDKYLGNSEGAGEENVVPLSMSNLFDIDAGFTILVWTSIF